MPRSSVTKLIDQFLLAYTIGDAHKRSRFLSETELQKLTFISEKEMVKKNEKGFNYYFIKLYYGPYSPDLKADLNHFVESGIVETESIKTATKIVPTQRCLSIFKDFGSISMRNRSFLKTITEVNRRYAPLDFKKLLGSVYRMQSPMEIYEKRRKRPTISQLPMRAPLLKPIPKEKASRVFTITPAEIATLEIYFDEEAFNSLSKATESAKKKPLLSFDEVF